MSKSTMSKSRERKIPEGLPPLPPEETAQEPTDDRPQTAVAEPEIVESEIVVEEEKYQLEQETVDIVALPPTCPRCGSTERTRLKEFSPRIETDRGCVIRYRTQCRGRIHPVGKDGNPVVDNDGNLVSYECGNRYKVKKLVPKTRRSAS